MAEQSRYTLKTGWDKSPKLGAAPGSACFVGRKLELERLIYALQHRTHGNILITGQRGVGKTALVFEAINTAQQKLAKPSPELASEKGATAESFVIAPVYLNIAHLENKNRQPSPMGLDPEAARSVLSTLVQRLYVALSLDPGPNSIFSTDEAIAKVIATDLSELYKKATREFKIEEQAQIGVTSGSSAEFVEVLEKEATLNAAVIRNWLLWLATAVLCLFQYASYSRQMSEWLSISLPLLLTVPIAFSIRRHYLNKVKGWATTESQISAKSYYARDNRIGNLEFDLERVQKKLSDLNVEVVYIIDELDKVEKSDPIQNLLRFLKPFLNQSTATFIFLAGTEFHAELMTNQAKREASYTYFTETYYLQRPAVADLLEFLRNALQAKNTGAATSSAFDDFAYYLIYLARGDFFDLHRIVREHISGFAQDGTAYIDIPALKNHQLIFSRLQRIHELVVMHLRGKSPASWHTNERMIETLYKRIETIVAAPGTPVYDDPTGTDVVDESVRLFHRFLYRCNAAKVQQVIGTIKIRGEDVPYFKYAWVGLTEAPPATLNFSTESESVYEKKFKRFTDLAFQLYRASIALTFPDGGASASMEEVVGALQHKCNVQIEGVYKIHLGNIRVLENRTPNMLFSNDDVIGFSKQIDQAITSLRLGAINVLRAALATKFPQMIAGQLNQDARLFMEVPNFRSRAGSIAHQLWRPVNNTSAPNFDKQLFICFDLPQDALSEADRTRLVPLSDKRNVLDLTTNSNPRPKSDGIVSIYDISEDFTALAAACKAIDEWWSPKIG